MSIKRMTRQFFFLATTLLVWACSDSETAPRDRSVASVAVLPANRTMVVGDAYQYQGRVLSAEGDVITGREIAWTSSDNDVATISTGGEVKAMAPGTTTITASVDGKTGTAVLVVNEAVVANVTVTPATPMMIEGESLTLTTTVRDANGRVLTGRTITWSSDDPTTATVDSTGRVSAKKPGSAAITARVGTVNATAHVTVNRVPVGRIDAAPQAISLTIGATRQLTVVTRDSAGNVLTGRIVNFTSDPTSVATVSATGLITGVGHGYATVFVASEGRTVGVAVTVTDPELPFNLVYHREGANNASEIMLLDPSTGAAPTLLNAGAVSWQPTPNASGTRIAFAVAMTEPGTGNRIYDIYAVDRTGTNMKQLTTADGVDDHPAWSPTANRIAYRHIDAQTSRSEIWVMNADGTGHTNLSADLPATMMASVPAWSPNGERIAFSTSQTGVTGTTSSIWTMNADGSDKRMLTSTLTGFDNAPTWSPDGRQIAFIRYYAGDADIAFVSSAGGDVNRLSLAGNQFAPAWSPDGSVIAFAQPAGTRSAIYTVRPDGTEVTLRTFNPAWGGGAEPAWIVRS